MSKSSFGDSWRGFRGFLALKSRCKDTTPGVRSTNVNENIFIIFVKR